MLQQDGVHVPVAYLVYSAASAGDSDRNGHGNTAATVLVATVEPRIWKNLRRERLIGVSP
jgi:hypothetical protein